MNEKKFDLEERLIDYAVAIAKLVSKLPKSYIGQYLGGQLLRSGTSPALNYGEAKSAESKNDFLHKMKICLKELRESFICLKIISRLLLANTESLVDELIIETNELISIFVKSILTAKKNNANFVCSNVRLFKNNTPVYEKDSLLFSYYYFDSDCLFM
jgi:four helix bundle protein